MRPPTELDRVPWQDLTHAYGSAADVPELIRALYDDDADVVSEAIYELYGNIHHQGTVFPAAPAAVPYLAHAVHHAPGKRVDLLLLLAVLANHDTASLGSPEWPGSPVAAVCAELARLLPDLLSCLGDQARAVRRATLRVVAAVADALTAEQRDAALARVDELYAGDPVPAVRADAAIALARLGRDAGFLESAVPEVRLASAILAAERSGPPYAAGLVEVFAADGASLESANDDFSWSDGTTQDARLTHLLTEEPDAGLIVAGRWIDVGDPGGRGSWLARKIAETWRDREPAVLDLLARALPSQDAGTRAVTLRAIRHWIDLVPEPSAELRDALLRYATSDDESAEPALLALVSSRDPRALDLVLRRPGPLLLAAAARHLPAAAAQLLPLIRRELATGATGNEGIALVRALTCFGDAARAARPELVDCLRSRRAAIVAARQLGTQGEATAAIVELLAETARATDDSDPSRRAAASAAAAAHYQLTGDATLALSTFHELLAGAGQIAWYLSDLQPLGAAAAPLLPLVEPELTADDEWTRMSAAEAHYWITGSADRALPIIAELVGPTPVGIQALRALVALGRFPAEIRPTLHHLATSPRRLLTDSPSSVADHQDEDARTLARTLLAVE
jgi:hypothetical protein